VDNDIDLRGVDGGDARGEGAGDVFNRGASGAGGCGDRTVVEENDFAAEIAELLGQLTEGAFGSDCFAGRDLVTVDEDDGLGECWECK
jgi:hypothetical protein